MAKKLISIPKLIQKVQKEFNKYIRLRDTNGGRDAVPCISCGKYLRFEDPDINAGHFFSVKYSFLRFHEDNVHAQCVGCNKWKGGNGAPYRIYLIQKIGEEKVQWLENNYLNEVKWSRDDLLDLLEDIKERINAL